VPTLSSGVVLALPLTSAAIQALSSGDTITVTLQQAGIGTQPLTAYQEQLTQRSLGYITEEILMELRNIGRYAKNINHTLRITVTNTRGQATLISTNLLMIFT